MKKLGHKYINIQNNSVITAADLIKCKNNELVRMAYIAAKINKLSIAENITKSLITSVKSAGEAALISKMFVDISKNYLSVIAAKEANRKGLQIIKYSHPLIKHVDHIEDIEKSLILAIIRQESVFNENAKSGAGAMGIMQILPNTAIEVSNELNLLYKTDNLIVNSKYNITIGSHYLKKILKYFDGSYILAIASYNAGMTNVKKWIEEYGDPRYYNDIDDIIEWIETIPFYETRNYVQRVIENIQIYRLILSKKNQTELNIENDLITDFIL
jgi:soluble lytic murein transglycosylase